jgi:hypothetical protein
MRAIEVTFQRVKVDRPEAAEWLKPGVYLHEGLRLHPVKTPLRIHARLDEPRLPEHSQVFRN